MGEAALDLLVVGTGGAAFGLLVAWVVRQARMRIDDPLVEITVTLLTPFVAYAPAEEILGVSGILAVVSSGLYLGYHAAEDLAPQTRLQAYSFWSVTTFLLESLLFILIGLQFPDAIDRLGSETTGPLRARRPPRQGGAPPRPKPRRRSWWRPAARAGAAAAAAR